MVTTYVSITPEDWSLCIQVANARQVSSIKKKGRDNLYKKNGWLEEHSVHVVGCVGELAVAKAIGVTWSGDVDTFKLPDLPGNIQVRHRSNPNWDLIVRQDAKDDEVYVLSRGMPPGIIEVAGWIKAGDAKQEQWLKDWGNYGKPSYFVPSDALNRMEDLK